MKSNLIGAVLAFGFATTAMAQDTGVVTINARVTDSVSMSLHDGAGTGGAANEALDHTINFDDVGGVNTATDALVQRFVTLRLRSNVGYYLKAEAAVTNAGSTSADRLDLDDIGFGITAVGAPTGSTLVDGTHTLVSDAVDAFRYDPTTADISAGEVTFPTSLNSLTANPVIASGSRISKGGNVKSAKNFITLETKYAILPQFFAPTTSDFTAVVNFTLSTTP